jgi:hypothetical protein
MFVYALSSATQQPTPAMTTDTHTEDQAEPTQASEHDVSLAREAVVAGLSYYGCLAALPHMRGIPPAIGTILATFLFLLLSLAVVRNIARWEIKPLQESFLCAYPLVAWYSVTLYAAQFKAARPLISPLESLLFLIACAFFGRLIARLVRERNMLVPIAVVLIMVDIFTVFVGPTGKALEKAPDLVEKLSIGLPEVGSAAGAKGGAGLAFIGAAGLGDFIFLGFFFVACARYGLRLDRTLWWVFILMTVAILGYLALPGVPGIPLLPFIAIGFLLANSGMFDFSRQERSYLAIGFAFVGVLLTIGVVLMRSMQ